MLVLTEDNFILIDRGAYNAQRYSVCHDMYFLYVKDKKRGEIFYPWVYFRDAHDGQGWVNPKPRGKNPVCPTLLAGTQLHQLGPTVSRMHIVGKLESGVQPVLTRHGCVGVASQTLS